MVVRPECSVWPWHLGSSQKVDIVVVEIIIVTQTPRIHYLETLKRWQNALLEMWNSYSVLITDSQEKV